MKLINHLTKSMIYKLTSKPECYVHIDNPKTLQEKRQVQYNRWCKAKGVFNGSYLPQKPDTLTKKVGWKRLIPRIKQIKNISVNLQGRQ
jgi:hypothetical protein